MAPTAAVPVAEAKESSNQPAPTADLEPAAAESYGHAPVGYPGLSHAPPPPGAPLTPSWVLALQRTAGNAAVTTLLGRARPIVQRKDPEEGEVPTVDEQTFDGFSDWAEFAIAGADEACVDAEAVSNGLASPYQERLRMLIAGVVEIRNQVSDGKAALSSGGAAPAVTSDPQGILRRLEGETTKLVDVSQAWEAVMDSGIAEFIARIGEAQIARARALASELNACLAELRELERIASGREMAEAFAQVGANAAISTAIVAITFVNPIAGLAVGIGSIVVQLSIDTFLGPSPPGGTTFTAAGVSAAGTAAQNLGKGVARLKLAGRRLGVAGAVAGTAVDLLESRDAIARYEAAAARFAPLSSKIDRLANQLDPLLPLLAYPAEAQALMDALRENAATLRENGQLVLAGAGQL